MSGSEEHDPGAYIGHEPELASEKIPGGVHPDDQRVAAHSTQLGPVGEPEPSGDDQIKEAGQDR